MSVKQILLDWNLRFPYDRRFRKKYNISFNSIEHRNTNQIDVYFDLYEDSLFDRYEKEYLEKVKGEENYKKTGEFLKKEEQQEMTEQQISEVFDNLDLSQFNDKKE